MNMQILFFSFSLVILLLIPLSANAGIPGVRTITLLYWSDPIFILIAASLGFAIARIFRWLPTNRSATVFYFILVPITIVCIPIAWMIDPVVYMISNTLNSATAEAIQAHPLIAWFTRPSYWYLDDPASLRTAYRLGLLILSLAISLAYQVLLLNTITREFGFRNSLKVSATISGTAFMILLLLAPLMPYSDLSWPR
jgi:hypothetical protein